MELNVVDGVVKPPDDLPVVETEPHKILVDGKEINAQFISQAHLRNIRRGDGKPLPAILGAWRDPATGEKFYELNMTGHSGEFRLVFSSATENTDSPQYLKQPLSWNIPQSSYPAREFVRGTYGLGHAIQVTAAHYARSYRVPEGGLYADIDNSPPNEQDPVWIVNREETDGATGSRTTVPGIVADQEGNITFEVKKDVSGVEIWGVFYED